MKTEQPSRAAFQTDRWSADLVAIFCTPGSREQEVRVTNFSSSAVRITGASDLIEGGRAWLKIGNYPPVAVCIVWATGTTAGCRFVGDPDAATYRAIINAATEVDRIVIADHQSRRLPARASGIL